MNYIIIPLPHLAFKIASWRITIDYFKLNEVMAPITGGISNMIHVRKIPNIYFTASKFLFFPSDLAKGKKIPETVCSRLKNRTFSLMGQLLRTSLL